MNYYTIRASEVTKWEEGRPEPLETYEIKWRKGALSAHMCSCPARVPCKHLSIIQDAIKKGILQEHWHWYWQDGWFRTKDQTVCIWRELIET